MPRAKLQSLLNEVVAQIATLETDIAQQTAVIEARLNDGKPTTQFRTVLTLWEASLAGRVFERDRLQAMLDGMD